MSDLFKRSTPKKSFAELSKMVYGPIKSGKSTFASEMKVGGKEPLFITTEDGHHNLDVSVENIHNWDGFKQAVIKIEKNKDLIQKQFSSIVIDLVSDLDGWCEDYVCKQLNIKHVSDALYSKGYSEHRKEMRREMAKLFAVLPITFIAHAKDKEVEINGSKYMKIIPSLSKGCLEYINGKVDLVGYVLQATTKKPVPSITFKANALLEVGTRYPHMARDFELSTTDMKTSYQAIETEFTNGLKKQ